MHALKLVLAPLALLAGLSVWSAPAYAAESYDNCTGFIDAVPATISTQGVWCLRQNLSTAITTGAAINITTNNVTIDCNDFKLGGLAAGDGSMAGGISAVNRQNVSVRRCGIRGFAIGINLEGGSGHLIEDNRIDNSLLVGVNVSGDNNRVQRNRVFDTGGGAAVQSRTGISAAADVIGNTVAGVFTTVADTTVYGISLKGQGNEARGNRVRGLVPVDGGFATGLLASASGVTLADNRITGNSAAPISGTGINGTAADTFCTGNTVVYFSNGYVGCNHAFGNLPAP
ncbi:MAG TPA: right-handed parallel beta-helix repeat-containing protein [Lysobacter sp.]